MVTIGIDTHKGTLAASAVDELGRELAQTTVSNTRPAYRRLRHWAEKLGPVRQWGIEGSGSYGSPFAQVLVAEGETVFEVVPSLTAAERRRASSRGKTDPIDALAIARVTLRETRLPRVQQHSTLDDLKLLVGARDELSAERTRVANRLHADLVILEPGYNERIRNLRQPRYLREVEAILDGSTGIRAQLARSRLARLRDLDPQIATMTTQLTALVAATGTSLPRLPGVGVINAATILGEAGNVRRYRSAPAFAAMAGTAPLPASSGKTERHRLNRGGNRQLNRALHSMALTQARIHPPAKAYLERRRAEGKTWREAMRCLKRLLANVVYRTMLADTRAQIGA